MGRVACFASGGLWCIARGLDHTELERAKHFEGRLIFPRASKELRCRGARFCKVRCSEAARLLRRRRGTGVRRLWIPIAELSAGRALSRTPRITASSRHKRGSNFACDPNMLLKSGVLGKVRRRDSRDCSVRDGIAVAEVRANVTAQQEVIASLREIAFRRVYISESVAVARERSWLPTQFHGHDGGPRTRRDEAPAAAKAEKALAVAARHPSITAAAACTPQARSMLIS